MSQNDLRNRKMMVACINANGERDLFVTTVLASENEISEGFHYDMAESKAADAGYSGPYVAFDGHDQRNIGRQVQELDYPITVQIKDETNPSGESATVYLQLTNDLSIKAKGYNECEHENNGRIVAEMSFHGGRLHLFSFNDIEGEEHRPTHVVNFSSARNDSLGPDQEPSGPLGLTVALEELDEDVDLRFWEVEVGIFDLKNDPNTPVETYNVVVAAETAGEANDKAQTLAEETIAAVSDMAFSVTHSATEGDPDDYR